MSRRNADEAHGVSPREQEIIDRIEAGEARIAIARSLGVRPSFVAWVDRTYVALDGALTAFDRMVRRGDARYQAALSASGGTYR